MRRWVWSRNLKNEEVKARVGLQRQGKKKYIFQLIQWPRGLRRVSRPLACWDCELVRIPPEVWMFVCCECCVLSGIGLCVGLITRPEEFYRVCVCVCMCVSVWVWSRILDNEEALAHWGLLHHCKNKERNHFMSHEEHGASILLKAVV